MLKPLTPVCPTLLQNLGNGRIGVRNLQDIKRKELFACGLSGTSGLHLLAGLGYDLALDALLSANADPSRQVGSAHVF